MPQNELAEPHSGHRKRLRDRFLASGLNGFADYEILELLLTFAIPRKDTKPLAKELTRRFGGLKGVLEAPSDELAAVPGLGSVASSFFPLLKETMTRYFREDLDGRDVLSSPQAVAAFARASLGAEPREVFQVVYVNSRNQVLGSERLAEGTIDRAAVFPRRVIEGAIKAKAAALIFVHNHPSGDPTPSEEDKALTRELTQAAGALDIAVHDHLVIGRDSYVSFRTQGLL